MRHEGQGRGRPWDRGWGRVLTAVVVIEWATIAPSASPSRVIKFARLVIKVVPVAETAVIAETAPPIVAEKAARLIASLASVAETAVIAKSAPPIVAEKAALLSRHGAEFQPIL